MMRTKVQTLDEDSIMAGYEGKGEELTAALQRTREELKAAYKGVEKGGSVQRYTNAVRANGDAEQALYRWSAGLIHDDR
jgi:hypothetical protein